MLWSSTGIGMVPVKNDIGSRIRTIVCYRSENWTNFWRENDFGSARSANYWVLKLIRRRFSTEIDRSSPLNVQWRLRIQQPMLLHASDIDFRSAMPPIPQLRTSWGGLNAIYPRCRSHFWPVFMEAFRSIRWQSTAFFFRLKQKSIATSFPRIVLSYSLKKIAIFHTMIIQFNNK